jgi:hypothetical protein
MGYSADDIKDFCHLTSIFENKDQGMNFDSFKKTFFPHLYQIQDSMTNEDEESNNNNNEKLKNLVDNRI